MGHFENLRDKIEEARRLGKASSGQRQMQAEQNCRQSMARSLQKLQALRQSGEVARPTVPLLFVKASQPDDGADERRCRELLGSVIAKGVLSATEVAKLKGEINARAGLSQAINPPTPGDQQRGRRKGCPRQTAADGLGRIPSRTAATSCVKQPPVPETSASLYGRRAGIQTALNAALVAGNPTLKLRQQIADIDRDLAVRAHADAVAAEAIQRDADAKIEAASATVAVIRSRFEAVLIDLAIPPEVIPMDDLRIQHAAADLERLSGDLAEANSALAAAKPLSDRIAGQVAALKDERDNIIARRSAGDQRDEHAAQLALIQADTEGLQPIAAEANAALIEARKVVAERAAARQRAATDLSAAEDAALITALIERADVVDQVMLDLVIRIAAVAKRQHHLVPWVASHALRTKLYMDAATRPDLATAGQPGSKWPALRTA